MSAPPSFDSDSRAGVGAPLEEPGAAGGDGREPRGSLGAVGIFWGVWLAVVAISPLCYGSVALGAQLWIGFAAGCCLLGSAWVGRREESGFPWIPVALFWGALLLSVIPLPMGLVELLSPERARLARDLAVDPAREASWLTLSLAPGASFQRIFQIAICWAAFSLATGMARNLRFTLLLGVALAVGIALLGVSEIWFRADGLGIWTKANHHPAGTFANRNHFANWMVMACFLAGGLALFSHRQAGKGGRGWKPLRNALIPLVLGGFYLAVSCGSRGGLLALAAGGGFWFCWMVVDQRLAARPKKRDGKTSGPGLLAPILAFAGLAAVIAGSGEALDRLAAGSLDFKAGIWRDTLAMAWRFPLFGVGPGGFDSAFPMYKSIGAGLGFLHAENDYAELAATGGLVGVATAVGILACMLAVAWKNRSLAGRERKYLLLGSGAAVIAFAFHAGFEFVSHVPSNAILAATCLGLFWGSIKPRDKRRIPSATARPPLPAVALASILLLATVWRAHGVWRIDSFERSAPSASGFEVWGRKLASHPNEPIRLIRLIRAYAAWVADDPGASLALPPSRVAAQAARILKWYPLDWPARLEQAWFELTHLPDAGRGFALARVAHQANPSQAAIPIEFARLLSTWNPERALEALGWVKTPDAGQLHDMLAIAWRASEDPGPLWKLTPATPAGWAILGEFATSARLAPLARAAFQKAAQSGPSVETAAKLIAVGQPDLAISHLPEDSLDSRVLALRFEALRRAGALAEAATLAERLAYSSLSPQVALGVGDRALLAAKLGEGGAQNLEALAQVIKQGYSGAAARLLPVAEGLLEAHPSMHALRWACFRLAMELGRPRDALDFIAPTVATLR